MGDPREGNFDLLIWKQGSCDHHGWPPPLAPGLLASRLVIPYGIYKLAPRQCLGSQGGCGRLGHFHVPPHPGPSQPGVFHRSHHPLLGTLELPPWCWGPMT